MFHLFIKALRKLYCNDEYLVNHSYKGRSIIHKLGFYLDYHVKGYHVDCEYNSLNEPFIMVHKRGSTIDNKMIIQCIKKGENYSLDSLIEYTSQYKNNLNFELGVLLILDSKNSGRLYCLEEGEVTQRYYFSFDDFRIQTFQVLLPDPCKINR